MPQSIPAKFACICNITKTLKKVLTEYTKTFVPFSYDERVWRNLCEVHTNLGSLPPVNIKLSSGDADILIVLVFQNY